MDYTWDGIKGGGTSPYEKGKYMPILRNHRYIFTIKEVKGPGFATLNEAVTSPDNFTNHNIVVVPIVIDAFTDITFNASTMPQAHRTNFLCAPITPVGGRSVPIMPTEQQFQFLIHG